jgi:hypothetical protein
MPLTITQNNVLRGSEADLTTLANVVFDWEGETELWRRVARVKGDAALRSRNPNFRGGKRRLSNRRSLTLRVPSRIAWKVHVLALMANQKGA